MMTSLLFMLACTPPDDDSAEVEQIIEPEDNTVPCEPELDVRGDDPPGVGDEWTVFMYCDDAMLMGAMILQFDPPEAAQVEDNVATFRQAGEALLMMQVGSRRAEKTVTVTE
jgi:hypothetical protein